jgi:hypothetical protein
LVAGETAGRGRDDGAPGLEVGRVHFASVESGRGRGGRGRGARVRGDLTRGTGAAAGRIEGGDGARGRQGARPGEGTTRGAPGRGDGEGRVEGGGGAVRVRVRG